MLVKIDICLATQVKTKAPECTPFGEDQHRKDACLVLHQLIQVIRCHWLPWKHQLSFLPLTTRETDHTGRGADEGSCPHHGGINTATTHESRINESPPAMDHHYRLCLHVLNKSLITNAERPRLTVSVDPLSFPFSNLVRCFWLQRCRNKHVLGMQKDIWSSIPHQGDHFRAAGVLRKIPEHLVGRRKELTALI